VLDATIENDEARLVNVVLLPGVEFLGFGATRMADWDYSFL